MGLPFVDFLDNYDWCLLHIVLAYKYWNSLINTENCKQAAILVIHFPDPFSQLSPQLNGNAIAFSFWGQQASLIGRDWGE